MLNLIRDFVVRKVSYVKNPKVPQALVEQWNRDGYVILRNAISDSLIDAANSDIAKFRKTCGETKDEHGYGGRIGLFHTQSSNSLKIALNAKVQDFLRWAFQDEPVLYGSLTFEAGTEQNAHQDAIFFHTEPNNCMAGAWTALEDVHADAGPLFYISGSHRWGLMRAEAVNEAYPDHARLITDARASGKTLPEMAQLAAKSGEYWSELLKKKIGLENSVSEPVLIKKGDVLIWHAHLVHGGLPRVRRELSRRSMVVHYVSRKAQMWDMNSFFLLRQDEFSSVNAMNLNVSESPDGLFVRHEKPVVY